MFLFYLALVGFYAMVAFAALASLALAVIAILLVVWSAYCAPTYLVLTIPMCLLMLHIQKEHFVKLRKAVNDVKSIK